MALKNRNLCGTCGKTVVRSKDTEPWLHLVETPNSDHDVTRPHLGIPRAYYSALYRPESIKLRNKMLHRPARYDYSSPCRLFHMQYESNDMGERYHEEQTFVHTEGALREMLRQMKKHDPEGIEHWVMSSYFNWFWYRDIRSLTVYQWIVLPMPAVSTYVTAEMELEILSRVWSNDEYAEFLYWHLEV